MKGKRFKTKKQKEEFLRMAAKQFAEILIAEIERRKEIKNKL
jgi:hypothetical protein